MRDHPTATPRRSAFTMVDIPVERADRPLFAASPIEPDVKTNEKPFDGRVYVMVIDDLHTRFGRSPRVKVAAKQFIERRRDIIMRKTEAA